MLDNIQQKSALQLEPAGGPHRFYKLFLPVLSILLMLFVISAAHAEEPCSYEKMQLILMPDKSNIALADLQIIEAALSEQLQGSPQYFAILERDRLQEILDEHRLGFEDFMQQTQKNTSLSDQVQALKANYFLWYSVNTSHAGRGYNYIIKLVNKNKAQVVFTRSVSGATLDRIRNEIIPDNIKELTNQFFYAQVIVQTGKPNSRVEIRSNDGRESEIHQSQEFDGRYDLTLPYGSYIFEMHLKNYRNQERSVCLLGPKKTVSFEMEHRAGTIRLAPAEGTPQLNVDVIIDNKIVDTKLPYTGDFPEGVHSIVVKKRGYYTWKKEITLNDGQVYSEPNVSLGRKPTVKALTRSAILPGMGSFYMGNRKKGLMFSSTYLVSLASITMTQLGYNDTRAVYLNSKEHYEQLEQGTAEEFQAAKDKAIDQYHTSQLWNTLRWTSVGSAAVIWSWSMIDAWISANNSGVNNISLQATAEGVTLAYQF